jgi:hypothetical protein
MQRDLAEEGHAQALSLFARAAMAEDFGPLAAMGAEEIAHILDDAEHGHLDLAEHVETLAGIEQGDVLRGRDDDRAGQRNPLGEAELGVARAGRHIDDEDVEFAPLHVAQHLLDRADHHRAAPDHWRVLGHEKTHRHDFQAMVLEGNDGLAVGRTRLAVDADHAWDRRAVDIGIHHADSEAAGRKAEREIDGDGRFAHAALAAGHGDDGADTRHLQLRLGTTAGQGRAFRRGALRLRRRRRLCGRGSMRGQDGAGGADAGKRGDGLLGGLADKFHRSAALGIDFDRETDDAVLDGETLNHALGDDVASRVRIQNGAEGGGDFLFVWFGHG